MAKVNMKEWRTGLLSDKKRTALPIMTHPGIDMAGEKVVHAVTRGEVHYRVIRHMAERYPSVAATMIMDLTVEAEAFGSTVLFSENEVPTVTGRVVSDSESVHHLKVPGVHAGRLPEYIRAARLAAENITSKPVFGGCIGPFSLAARLFDMSEILTAIFIEPDSITALLEKCTAFLLQYLTELKKAGINGVIMAEPAAGLLDETMCDTFSTAFVRQLVDTFQDEHFLFIVHNCGNSGQVTRSMINTGAHGLHFGNRVDLVGVLQLAPHNKLVMGNIDPAGILKMASPAEITQHVTALLEATRDYPNFILSTGCDTPPGVPPENIHAFFDALNAFNNQIN